MEHFIYDKKDINADYYEILENLISRWEYEVVEFKEAKGGYNEDKIGQYFFGVFHCISNFCFNSICGDNALGVTLRPLSTMQAIPIRSFVHTFKTKGSINFLYSSHVAICSNYYSSFNHLILQKLWGKPFHNVQRSFNSINGCTCNTAGISGALSCRVKTQKIGLHLFIP